MEPNNGAAQSSSNDSDLQEVLSELHAWRKHVNKKDAADDEQLLRTFTDMGETVTIVQQRTKRFSERTS